MSMVEFLEKDKGRLLSELGSAKTPEQAALILETELDQLMYRYNEQAEFDRGREASAYMSRALKSAAALITAQGEPKIWEASGNGEKGAASHTKKGMVFLVLGIICGVLAVMMQVGVSMSVPYAGLPTAAAFMAAGVALVFLGGRFWKSSVNAGAAGEKKVELMVSPDKAYRCLHTAVLTMDQSLKEIEEEENWKKTHGDSSDVNKPAAYEDVEFYSELLEAAISGDGEYALEKLSDLKFYLHKKGIEAVTYSSENAGLFDSIPSKQQGTIRPALTDAQGALLKKGLVAGGK